MKIEIELSDNQAAALHRLCSKITHSDAMGYLYAHLPAQLRSNQAYDMTYAAGNLQRALEEASIRSWPWIESGSAE